MITTKKVLSLHMSINGSKMLFSILRKTRLYDKFLKTFYTTTLQQIDCMYSKKKSNGDSFEESNFHYSGSEKCIHNSMINTINLYY